MRLSMNSKNRLAGIEFLRFFFMIWICLIHIWKPFNLYNGAIGVEFFFIVSGYFLYLGFLKGNQSVINFTKNRFWRLFPTYIIGICLTYVIVLFDQIKDGEKIEWFKTLSSFTVEGLMIQDLGCFSINPANPVSWYVSVLFIGGTLIYASLKFNRQITTHCVLPAFILGYYVLIASRGCR